MINELSQLASALEQAGIQTQNWHRKYKLIPKIRANTPCIRITTQNGKGVKLSKIEEEDGKYLRKYGTNQGSYPCMNLAPLYRVTDERIIKSISELKKRPERIDNEKLLQIKSWCQSNNWSDNFLNKYRISMQSIPAELSAMNLKYPPLTRLIQATQVYADNPALLHKQMEEAVWEMLRRRESVAIAFDILLYPGKKEADPNKDFGSISVAFVCAAQSSEETSADSSRFVRELNEKLLEADVHEQDTDTIDAFGDSFCAVEEPMPSVRLAGGFDVTIRTMFKEQYCQTRYGRIENASYPIAPSNRKKLASALEWLSSEANKDQTWTTIDKKEVLFAYPYQLPKKNISIVNMFRPPDDQNNQFKYLAKCLITELQQTKAPKSDSHGSCIQLLILRKNDKARTKVVYTRQTDPIELERCSEAWTIGCSQNLPIFKFGQPRTPFPLNATDIMNCFWYQNGEKTTEQFKPIPKYHGMELLMDPSLSVRSDLCLITRQALTLGGFLGKLSADRNYSHETWQAAMDILALLGLFLYRENIRKDDYMENLPYLYGQLLKVSDELHAFYCQVVRNGDIPQQLAGGALFLNAAESPSRTLPLLSQRMMPYYTWAKSYRLKGCKESGKESARAGWLIRMCDQIMTTLREQWTTTNLFTDEEKAQLFIGYLAEYPKNETTDNTATKEKENNE